MIKRSYIFLALLCIGAIALSPIEPSRTIGSRRHGITSAPAATANRSLLNLEKLSLPADTAVGTQVSVTDGFYVSAHGDELDGFFRYRGTGLIYDKIPDPTGLVAANRAPGGDWFFYNGSGESHVFSASEFNGVDYPWQVGVWIDDDSNPVSITLAHPAVQQLAAPGAGQGGVFVSGGTQDGVYPIASTRNGKTNYVILGAGDPSDDSITSVAWLLDITTCLGGGTSVPSPSPGWVVRGADAFAIYYSFSNVATPDLASDWKNAIDDSPASITVFSLTLGAITKGIVCDDLVFQNKGDVFNRRAVYVCLSMGVYLVNFDGTWNKTDAPNAGGTLMASSDNDKATPDLADWTTSGLTVTADYVAAEANWEAVP